MREPVRLWAATLRGFLGSYPTYAGPRRDGIVFEMAQFQGLR